MKKAIIMARVSSDEQAKGYSLGIQEESLRKHCANNEIEIVQVFKEDHSAKNFDRPEWKKLLQYIRSNKNNVDYVLFTSWDRFSRNITDALIEIRNLKKVNIEVKAIEQPIDISIPENKAILALYLAMPEIDNDRRSIKIRGGVRAALKSGRLSRKAPRGYRNTRDENNKPLIVAGDDAKHIQYLFKEVAKGRTQSEIRDELNIKGFKISCNGSSVILRNEVYMGKVVVPEEGDEPMEVIEGIHKGLISEKLFCKVQELLEKNLIERNKPKAFTRKDNLPLRGIVRYSKCQSKMTGSGSRGKLGKKYFYYHCNDCANERYRSEKANRLMEDVLDEFKFKKGVIKLYEELVKHIYERNEKDNTAELSKVQKSIVKQKQRISNLQDMLIDGVVDQDAFQSMNKRYKDELILLENRLHNMSSNKLRITKYLKKGVNAFSKMSNPYKSATALGKQQILKAIFPLDFEIVNEKCRTPRINEVLRLMLSLDGHSEKIKKGELFKNLELSLSVESEGFEPSSKRRIIKLSTCLFFN
jgi:site-specific DNA recombinase